MPRHGLQLRSLTHATDIDVLPDDALVEQSSGFTAVRTPSNPTHYYGNFLLLPEAPRPGDRQRWERWFDQAIAERQPATHRTFCWDTVDGDMGAAREEFAAVGYELTDIVGLVASPDELAAHPAANAQVQVRALDPRDGADVDAWRAVEELQVASREPGHDERDYREHVAARNAARRERFIAGDGAWFAAFLDGRVVASCGVVVTEGRGRFQAVDTAPAWRRRGIARRIVFEAGRAAVERHGARRLVIVADADYHALALYESLGFRSAERTCSACWWPTAPRAGVHPVLGHLARPASG